MARTPYPAVAITTRLRMDTRGVQPPPMIRKVKKIKVGDIEIDNPDERLIEAMRKKLATNA